MTFNFTVPNKEQRKLLQECGIEPAGYAVTLEDEDRLCLLHLKSRNEIMICKNRRVTNGNQ